MVVNLGLARGSYKDPSLIGIRLRRSVGRLATMFQRGRLKINQSRFIRHCGRGELTHSPVESLPENNFRTWYAAFPLGRRIFTSGVLWVECRF